MHIKDIETFEQFLDAICEMANEANHFPKQWITGGISGGTVYKKGLPITPNEEPEDKYLPVITHMVFPEISPEQLEEISQNPLVWIETDDTQAGPYNDYTTYKEKHINFKELYESLKIAYNNISN
jgi:hypothetical protein